MAIDAEEWRTFYERSREVMGPAWATTLMKAIPPMGAEVLATRSDLAILRTELRGEFSELRGEFSELRGEFSELRGEFSELRGDVRAEISELRAELADRLRAQTWTLSGLLVGTLGVAVTLARLA